LQRCAIFDEEVKSYFNEKRKVSSVREDGTHLEERCCRGKYPKEQRLARCTKRQGFE
jgi:hypothetical protein